MIAVHVQAMQPFLDGLDAVADRRPDTEIVAEMRAKLGATAADCTPKVRLIRSLRRNRRSARHPLGAITSSVLSDSGIAIRRLFRGDGSVDLPRRCTQHAAREGMHGCQCGCTSCRGSALGVGSARAAAAVVPCCRTCLLDAVLFAQHSSGCKAVADWCRPSPVPVQAIKAFRSELKSFIHSQWANVAGLRRHEILGALPGTHRGDQGYAHSLLRLPLPRRLRDTYEARRAAAAAEPPHLAAAAAGAAEKYGEERSSAADPHELVGFGDADPDAGEDLFAELVGAEADWETNMTLTRVAAEGTHAEGGRPEVAMAEAGGLAELAQLIKTPQFEVRLVSAGHCQCEV